MVIWPGWVFCEGCGKKRRVNLTAGYDNHMASGVVCIVQVPIPWRYRCGGGVFRPCEKQEFLATMDFVCSEACERVLKEKSDAKGSDQANGGGRVDDTSH